MSKFAAILAIMPAVALVVACAPAPEGTVMTTPDPAKHASGQPTQFDVPGGDSQQAAVGPRPQLPSEAGKLSPAAPADTPDEAIGRRTLSTAFVRVGPDGLLTVTLRNGRVVILRHVTMGPKKFCGEQFADVSLGSRFCGAYGDVAAANPGNGPITE